ncbi:MAG: NAD(P)H-nitrite reductase [Bacteroidetes bacterium]|nr:MAG: NAD(P)H-nitrite reductase [Bacteroidota bacterium]
MIEYDYIIVGAGIAGIKAVEGIRSVDSNGKILLINGEDREPYKRTQISKQLVNGFEKDAFAIHAPDWFDANSVTVLSNLMHSFSIDNKTLATKNHQLFHWNKLILAMGSSPTPLALKGNGKTEINYFRTAYDAEQLIQKANEIKRVLVIGGGVLGVELASALAQMGKTVSLVHAQSLLMHRQLDEALSSHLYSLLQSNGIQVIMDEKIKSVSKTGNGKLLVEIGEMIHLLTDFIIAANGVTPSFHLAEKAGLEVGKGIKVNNFLQTSHPDVFAAGDVAQHPNGQISGLWHDAENQGYLAGVNAAGRPSERSKRKYRMKLEVFGQFYFSLNVPKFSKSKKELVHEKNNMYYRFFFEESKLDGVLMLNDKVNAKQLEKAVNEGWDREKVIELFCQ